MTSNDNIEQVQQTEENQSENNTNQNQEQVKLVKSSIEAQKETLENKEKQQKIDKEIEESAIYLASFDNFVDKHSMFLPEEVKEISKYYKENGSNYNTVEKAKLHKSDLIEHYFLLDENKKELSTEQLKRVDNFMKLSTEEKIKDNILSDIFNIFDSAINFQAKQYNREFVANQGKNVNNELDDIAKVIALGTAYIKGGDSAYLEKVNQLYKQQEI